MSELTPMQQAFLDALFSEEAKGDIRKAMDAAGYSKSTAPGPLLAALHEEIVERSRVQLAANASKAAIHMGGLIDDPTQLGAQVKLQAAMQVLDRVGIVKKDKVEVSGGFEVGLFVLPPKDSK
jgi:hypothetical protein